MLPQIFNGAIAAAAMSAAFELGLFEALKRQDAVDIRDYCAGRYHQGSLNAILYALACFGVVQLDASGRVVRKGVEFERAYEQKGYFLWLFRGYGSLLENLAESTQLTARTGAPETWIHRNGHYISQAGRDYGSILVDKVFDHVYNQMPTDRIADLGCGSANRLIQMASRHSGLTGVGIDRDPAAVALARNAIAELNLSGRLSIVTAEVGDLPPLTQCHDVAVVFCFFMGHDLWPREKCQASMRRIRSTFPNVKRFLLCDTYRSELPPDSGLPTFTLGFEFLHAVMGQYVPTLAEWRSLFPECGWKCVAEHPVQIPYSTIFDLRPI